MIKYFNEKHIFDIETLNTSYIIKVDNDDRLRVLYYGKKLINPCEINLDLPTIDKYFSSAEKRSLRSEFPTREKAYYCEPCVAGVYHDGSRDIQLKYISYNIKEQDDHEILEIHLHDRHYPLEIALTYKIYKDNDIIEKNAIYRNIGKEAITLNKMKSGTLLTPNNENKRLMTFVGGWGCEYQKQYLTINQGRFCIENTRGTSGSHQNIPFFALDDGTATETSGNIYYGLLHHSGDFRIDFEKDFTGQLTVSAGVNDFDCEITLSSDEEYTTPIFSIGFTDCGYEKMSETLYDYQFDHHLPQSKIHQPFPIIYNTWYPYQFDVDEEKCLSFIDKAKKIGAELFVIDDGWFGRREKDTLDGLGDWYCHPGKFPNGLRIIADKAHKTGMKFGLWIEPEMINLKSDLYKEHPEWVIRNPKIDVFMIRNQCVLNLARDDVREFIWDVCDRIITEYDLDYLKWDMNSYLTETGNNDGDFRIRFIENLYEIWRRINEKYPHVLLENCASGGGRSDYGLAKYSDRINRSDNSDPVDVLKIHEGFSTIFLPRLAGGAGNVAKNPHHLSGRDVPLKYRALLGMTGSMSIGVNILKSDENEINELIYYITEFKKIRHITQNAYLYRISSAFDSPVTVWEYLSRDRKSAVVFMFANGINFSTKFPKYKLRGLSPEREYCIRGENKSTPDETRIVHGDTLMNYGLSLKPKGDYDCQVVIIEEK